MYVLMFSVCTLCAQHLTRDTTLQLPVFNLKTTRFDGFSTGVKQVKTDSLVKLFTAQNSLAQLLALNSQVFIKSYGVGQLATTSFRGAASHHTAILWNGINLQSSMHGQTDFSLIPVGMVDDVDVFYGGNAALYGGGAIGGAIGLNNTTGFNKQEIKYQVTLGSFGQQQHWVGLTKGNDKRFFKAKFFNSQAKNNISFYNESVQGKPLQKLPHAEQLAYGTLLEAGFKPSIKQEINLRYWYGFSDRNLPPTIGAAVSNSYQIDASHRLGADWKYQRTKSVWIARAAWLNEYINYQDPTTYIVGKSTANALVVEVENSVEFKFLKLNVGLNNTLSTAQSSGYTQNAIRNGIAAFASIKYSKSKKLNATLNLRQEFVDDYFTPFTASVGAEYALPKKIVLVGHVNKSYRLPTLNDLYWVTGNKKLLPESGFGQELGLKKNFTLTRAAVQIQTNAFNRTITNWIIWQPLGGTWTPQNLKEVWSRGAEFNMRFSYNHKNWIFIVKSDWSYVLSTNQKANVLNDATVGKQLIYTPRLTHQHLAMITYKKLGVGINYTYTGYRFTTSDNTRFINDYGLLNAFASFGYTYKKINTYLKLQANNVLQTSYQVLPARPMPLQNWLVSLGITF